MLILACCARSCAHEQLAELRRATKRFRRARSMRATLSFVAMTRERRCSVHAFWWQVRRKERENLPPSPCSTLRVSVVVDVLRPATKHNRSDSERCDWLLLESGRAVIRRPPSTGMRCKPFFKDLSLHRCDLQQKTLHDNSIL